MPVADTPDSIALDQPYTVTLGDVLTVLPFGNLVSTFQLKGSTWSPRPGRPPLPQRRPDPAGGAGDPAPRRPGRAARIARPAARRLPRLHHRARVARLLRREAARGWPRGGRRRVTQIKLKVGADLEDDVRRCALARDAVGPDIRSTIDANQRWDVARGDRVDARARRVRPALDRGADQPRRRPRPRRDPRAVAPIAVATGEHVANRVVFKQMLQAGALDFCQIDAAGWAASTRTSRSCCSPRSSACRSARTPAASACARLVQHLSIFDYVAVSGTCEDRVTEYVDHLHEHFTDPVVMDRRQLPCPPAPGYSARMSRSPWPTTATRTARSGRPASDAGRCAVAVADVCAAHGTPQPADAIGLPPMHPSIINVALGMRTPGQVGRNVLLHAINTCPSASGAISALRD